VKSIRLWVAIPTIIVVALGVLYLRPHFELYRLEHADPIQDARRAVARGDRRLAVVYVLRLDVPGADSILGRDRAYEYELWSVSRFTSDLGDDLTNSINGAAMNYAKAYNLELLRDGKGCFRSKPAA